MARQLVIEKGNRMASKEGSLYEKDDSVKVRALSRYDKDQLMMTDVSENIKKATTSSVGNTTAGSTDQEELAKLRKQK